MRAKRLLLGSVVALAMAIAGACGPAGEPAPAAKPAAAAAWPGSVTYALGRDIGKLYPNASWLPQDYQDYQSKYRSLGGSIQMFTEQSLQRDGISYTSVKADDNGTVTLTGTDRRLAQYAQMHPAFADKAHATQALNGVTRCQETGPVAPSKYRCWDPVPLIGQAWALFLPLGMPLVNQQAIILLDYPPAVSLLHGDYLKNATMDRWSRVLAAAGVANPVLYETIVDTRPIAAPGTGQADYLPDPADYFNARPDRFYITPMVSLLTNPPSNTSATNSLPVQVLGGPAQRAWCAAVGETVHTLSTGSTTLPGATKATSWVAGNHPNVTSYQCCPNDPYQKCTDTGTTPPTKSYSLIADEQVDLQVACTIMTLSRNQSLAPAKASETCSAAWGGDPAKLLPANARTLCVQAKLDNQNPAAKCSTVEAAEAYCTAYGNNACFDFTCSVPAAKAAADKR